MAGLRQIARENATELRDGIAWVVVWKTGRSWHAHPFWLDDADCFEPDDMPLIEQILEKDENAVMLNGYYCGHFGEDMNADELAAGIDWHYSRGANLLKNSGAIPEPVPEPDPEPADPDFIQAATDNPRQAHLCYHGRRARTRKKNRHILERKAERIRRIRKRGENMSKPYIVCPDCGSNLDPGERCDCSARYHAEEKEDDTDADSDIEQAPRGLRPAASA